MKHSASGDRRLDPVGLQALLGLEAHTTVTSSCDADRPACASHGCDFVPRLGVDAPEVDVEVEGGR